jgi:hypothetical protein
MSAINQGKRAFNMKNPFKVIELTAGVHRDRMFA